MDRKYFEKSEDFSLSKHFKMSEMTFKESDKYVMPDDACLRNLVRLCRNHLEPLRGCFGPITINSGYRDADKNIIVGGARNSYHLFGCACDIHVPSTYWGIRYARYLLVNNGSLLCDNQIAELIFHVKEKYIHLAMRKNDSDTKFYVRILSNGNKE